MTRFAVFLDACVLVPVALTDTLLRLADRGLFRPLWSQQVLDEATHAVADIRPAQLAGMRRRVTTMNDHFPDALVQGWEPFVSGIVLPDPNDRHVVAAAVRGGADCILTHNLRDFPTESLAPLGLEAIAPDGFLLDQLDLAPALTVQVVRAQAAATGTPPHPSLTALDVLASLAGAGAPAFAAELQRHL